LLEEKSQIDSNLKNSLSLNENLQHELKLVQADFSDLKQKITLYEKALDKVKF
jgi:DNA-directed RNA polymerase specialized sigma54-like protein